MSETARVLLVEDNAVTVQFVGTALIDDGYEVVIAPDGALGLEHAVSFRPDVIVLDIRLPVMDGFSFLEAYQQADGRQARIIVMTASVTLADRVRQLGIADVFEKPFEIGELLSCVRRYAVPGKPGS